ncbi:hypothetical protein BDV95DRAFT_568207 [Massariosphaeria phaeospora]|uniref:Methyltransferase type 11 domain-containing protein n=1 Tax=Massariosphaeria phaeospora TaxID=100035 RepID=A0A7C8IFI7_9PLEO|nr:hypothetical protein BDV95DRAFT_568207 [Massariosphaeria phaeospora]
MQDIKLAPASYTHLFVNFGIFAMPTATLSACAALVRPNGFIGLSSWARIGVYPLIARAVSRLASPPKFPTEAEMMKVLTQDRAWDSPAYITQVLEEAGFTGVEAEEKTARVNNLTPAVFCETMDLMLGFVEKAWAWEEGVRAEVAASLRKVAVEEAGGEEEIVWVDFKGIVATGRKA